jgi:hypothetical protein
MLGMTWPVASTFTTLHHTEHGLQMLSLVQVKNNSRELTNGHTCSAHKQMDGWSLVKDLDDAWENLLEVARVLFPKSWRLLKHLVFGVYTNTKNGVEFSVALSSDVTPPTRLNLELFVEHLYFHFARLDKVWSDGEMKKWWIIHQSRKNLVCAPSGVLAALILIIWGHQGHTMSEVENFVIQSLDENQRLIDDLRTIMAL